jgi:phytoene dehydrogenase-like protein
VRSDVVDGFTLDHGFQVLLTAYPACRELLDYQALRLRRFPPGALIRHHHRFSLLADPWRQPGKAISAALCPVGTWGDKLRLAKLRHRVSRGSLEDLYQRPQSTTIQYLQQAKFTPQFIDQFFRPFLGGVFLDESLQTPSRMFEFVFRMFAAGEAAVPAEGMAAIPRQLVERLPRGTLRLQSSVLSIHDRTVTLSDGRQLRAEHLVIATESDAAARLLGRDELATAWNQTTTIYYACDHPPGKQKSLMLRGDEQGPVQTAVILSNVAAEYSPPGKSLVSVSLSSTYDDLEGDLEQLDAVVRDQLRNWFGDSVSQWRRLCVYRIPYGLPRLSLDPVAIPAGAAGSGGDTGVYVCGDHCETASIQGAISSGIRAAQAILAK